MKTNKRPAQYGISSEEQNNQKKIHLEEAQGALKCQQGTQEHFPKGVGFLCIKSGDMAADLDKLEEALEWYDKAIELDPKYAVAYKSKGNTLYKLHKYEEALEWYDKAIALNPGYADAYYGKGHTLNLLQRYEEAIKSLDTAIGLNPAESTHYNSKVYALTKLENFDAVLECLEKLIEHSNDLNVTTLANKLNAFTKFNKKPSNMERWKDVAANLLTQTNYSSLDLKNMLSAFAKFDEQIDLERRNEKTPLEFALIQENASLVEVLLKYSASTKTITPNFDGLSPLHLAAKTNKSSLIEVLLKYDANPLELDRNGYLPSYYATEEKSKNLLNTAVSNNIKSLIDSGETFDTDSELSSDLALIVKKDNIETLKCLLDGGLDIRKLFPQNSTILEVFAQTEQSYTILDYLALTNSESEGNNMNIENESSLLGAAVK